MIPTLAFVPAAPEDVARRLDTKMRMVRDTLISKGEFLADSTTRERVRWVPSGTGHKLVVKAQDPSTTDVTDPPLSPTDSTSSPTDSTSSPTDAASSPHSDDSVGTDVPPPSPDVPATLTMVMQVVPGQSWLYPDGKWTGPTQFVRRFSDIKLLCTGTAPSHMRFHDDYKTSIANLNGIMDEMRTSGNPTMGVITTPDEYLKLRHNLFVVSY
jgi:hypothetical protein